MNLKQHSDCKEWQFYGIPAFSSGTMSPLFADCGTGLFPAEETAEKSSFMHIFSGVLPEDITAYASALSEAGFKKVFENKTNGNLFYQFAVPEGAFYVSLMKNDGTARFILDRCKTAVPENFGYTVYNETRSDTVLAQYSLHYDAMIRGVTCDCGMNYVFRLRDNSLIIIDGGEFEQSTDLAVNDYMAFLRELTGVQDGEKLRVSLWLCTHAHNDHCDFLSKILRFHADEITVERAAFDFPSPENVRHSVSVAFAKQRLAEKFPDIKYIKLHAGHKFNIANAELEILVSAEDAVGTVPDEPFPGTNDTSVLFTVKADGMTALFLADCGDDNGAVLKNNYGEKELCCTFLQAAHHGINEIRAVYDKIKAEKVLLPQCRMNMDTRFDGIYANLCRLYGEQNILFAHDKTDIFTLKDGSYSKTERKHTGTAYDGSEW